MTKAKLNIIPGPIRFIADLAVTLLLWAYYTIGFIVFFACFYIAAAVLCRRASLFQKLNHLFYKGFFRWLRLLVPWQRIIVEQAAADIRSAVVICNHVSYLDPLLLMAMYPKHKTIVKSSFFRAPIFGRVITAAGYMPSSASGAELSEILMRQMTSLPAFLEDGGNLFVFPEGTRSRDGSLGRFNKGAFKIARKAGARICVVRISGTDRLFEPGRFVFHACRANTLKVTLCGEISLELQRSVSIEKVADQARLLLMSADADNTHGTAAVD